MRVQKEATAAKRQYDQLEKSVRHQEQRRADIETQVKNLRGQLKANYSNNYFLDLEHTVLQSIMDASFCSTTS